MQDPDIFPVSAQIARLPKLIVGQAEGRRREEFLAIAIRRKRAWFTHQRPDEMLVLDTMLLFAHQTRQSEGPGCANVSLQGFCPHPDQDACPDEPGGDGVGIVENLNRRETRNGDASFLAGSQLWDWKRAQSSSLRLKRHRSGLIAFGHQSLHKMLVSTPIRKVTVSPSA